MYDRTDIIVDRTDVMLSRTYYMYVLANVA